MHQSIPVMPIPPQALVGHLLTFQSPGGGAFEILSVPRVRDLPTPGGGEAPT